LWIIATIEAFLYALNEAIIIDIWHVMDIGGSIVIHIFGAFFGLSALIFYPSNKEAKA